MGKFDIIRSIVLCFSSPLWIPEEVTPVETSGCSTKQVLILKKPCSPFNPHRNISRVTRKYVKRIQTFHDIHLKFFHFQMRAP